MMTTRNSDQRQHVADVIRSERLQRGWSVGEAATHLDVSGSVWSRWETATSLPRPAMLLRIGELLELPGDWMVPGGTPSHPVATVDIDERLARIEERQQAILERIEAERERIEELYQRLLEGGNSDRQHSRDANDRNTGNEGALSDR